MSYHLVVVLSLLALCLKADPPPERGGKPGLWELARAKEKAHRFSTLFTAHDVKRYLSTEEGLKDAMDWCRESGVTRVYLETFRDGYQADADVLARARDRFREAGFDVRGCVTPTQVGKKSNRWNIIGCYTDLPTQERIESIFEFTARLFDVIMIDDFWFTECSCAECDTARKSRKAMVGDRCYETASDSWEDYRAELMVQLSRDRVIGPAKRVNPKAELIIKYPQWYDMFHERGYDVARETTDFDHIWVGTETRDYADARWGGTVQYEAYFIMRWLGGIGGEKCGGGWYDWLGTTEKTYVEQARQTVLAGARESMLFCYGGLQGTTGPKNIAALRTQIPELLELSEEVAHRKIIGVAAYKPIGSAPGDEKRVFDFVGMLGIPLVPCHEFPTDAPAAFFSVHALKDPAFGARLAEFVASGKPVLLTDGLVAKLGGTFDVHQPNVRILPVKRDPKRLLELKQGELDALRERLLQPFQVTFHGPNQVALYLFADGSWVAENFANEQSEVRLNGKSLSIPPRSWLMDWK